MKLHVLGSSSNGNGYIMQSSTGESLIIECGLPLIEVKKSLAWRLSGVAAAVVSHHHCDHAGRVREYSRAGIRIVAPYEVIERNQPLPFSRIIEPNRGYVIGKFRVRTLPMTHANNDGTACECFGYIIEHPEMGRTLFATDTVALPCPIRGLHHVMIEANYDDEILDRNIADGIVAGNERARLQLSHMEIGTVERMMQKIDMTDVVDVLLLHLSSRNADAASFVRRIAGTTGKPCQIARPGMVINFDKSPY
nr:MAG TPA: RNaseZ [Caudoviricetes sp.]